MAIASKPKPPSHYKKRVGKHHKTSKHYMKAYWPYLPVTAIVGLGIAVNAFLSSPATVLGAHSDLSPASLLQSTNQQRSAHQEAQLQLNNQLDTAAQAKASDMVKRNYWSHQTPDGKQPWSFITATGYTYQLAGENLAYGFTDASAVINGWMNSQEHRDNLLNSGYQDVGFGIASSPDYNGKGPETIVVALYAEPVSTGATNISFTVQQTQPQNNVLGASVSAQQHPVSRIQLITGGNAPWSLAASLILMAAALLLFVIRHGRAWHRVLRQSEAFVVSHPLFDIMLASAGMLGFVLSRVTGITL